jgi:PAS domain S-box-containing protein
MGIFDFGFNPLAIFSLFAVITNSIVIYLIFSESLQVSTNRWYSYSIISLIVWGITEAFSRLSVTGSAASFWEISGSIGWIFVAPLFLAFTIAYTGREKILSKVSAQFLLFGPALFFLFLSWTTGLVVNHNIAAYHKVAYDWVGTLETPLFWLVFIWIDILFTAALWLFIRFRSTSKDSQRRKQTLFMIVGLLVPFLGGSITNGLLPIFGIDIFKLAVPLTTVMSVTVTYAIFKYRLFAINPATVVSNIVETMNEILIVFDPNHYIEFVNNAVENILGYKKEKLIGQHLKMLVGSDWNNFQEDVLNPLDEGKQVSSVEVNLQTLEGQKIPVSFSTSQFMDKKGRVFAEVGVATDIRKIRELVIDTIAERNKLTTVMQSIVDGVFALDKTSKVILANPAVLSMLKLQKKDILGKKLDDCLTMFNGEQKVSCKDLLPLKNLTKDKVIAQLKSLKITTSSSDKHIFVNLTSSAIKEGKEVGLGAIITMSDVSKEKELEEMKIDFVSMAAHELRTPITSARGYLSLIQKDGLDKLSPEQRSYIDKAFIASTQLASLVDNLLAVSRIEQGAVKLQVASCDWIKTVKDCVANFQPLAKEKKIKLIANLPQKLSNVLIDKFRITEVLSNLIDNALAYTKSNGKVVVEVEEKNDEIITNIKDTGIGIPQEALPKLFTKFFRVSGILEQGSKGTGLGLYISKAIVEMHHGRIWVNSILGKGSSFSFALPALREKLKYSKKEKTLPTSFKNLQISKN